MTIARYRRFALPMALLVMACGCMHFEDKLGMSTLSQLTGRQHRQRPKQVATTLPPRETAEACIATAEEMQRAGHLREAVLLYERARKYDPEAINYARHLAVLYAQQGNNQRASAEFEQALQDNPKDADLLNDFGYFQCQRGQWHEAEQQFRRALEKKPQHQGAQMNLGLALAQQRRYDEALAAFEKAVGPAAAHSNLGVILAEHEQVDLARRAFQQALAIDPSLQQPHAFLAYFDQGRPSQDEQPARR